MSFAEWHALPAGERRHRTLLYLAERQVQEENRDEADRAAWVKNLKPPSEFDTR